MIISTSHKFIFVHIPKTAGLAVTDAFERFGRSTDRTLLRSLTRRLPFHEAPQKAHFKEHEAASKMVQKLGQKVFDSFHSFSVVRDPFDHAVSHYEYMKQFRIKKVADKVGKMSFEQYLENRKKPPHYNDTIFVRMKNLGYYTNDENGELLVDRIIKFENISDEIPRLASDLGIHDLVLRQVNKTKSKSKSRPYPSYYNAESYEMVKEIYKTDFEQFGYSRNLDY